MCAALVGDEVSGVLSTHAPILGMLGSTLAPWHLSATAVVYLFLDMSVCS